MKFKNSGLLLLLVGFFGLISCDELGEIIDDAQVNSHPIVLSDTIDVSESTSAGTIIGSVLATDLDEDDILRYSIVAGNEDELFSIGELVGELTLAGQLDYEEAIQHSIVVNVSDGKDSVEAIYTINVIDENDDLVLFSSLLTQQSWDCFSALYDGALEGDWSSFQLAFTGDMSGGTFQSTGVPTGYEAVWPSSGTWEWIESSLSLYRNDEIEIVIQVDEANLTLEFTLPEESGRQDGIYDAPWIFQFSAQN